MRMDELRHEKWDAPDALRAWEVRADGDAFAILSIPLGTVDDDAVLTPSELDIVYRILRGESNKSIAESRGTAVRTVANQVASVFQKLGLASRAELVAHLSRRHQMG